MLSKISGVANTRLTLVKLKTSFLALPPTEEQKEIVRRVNQLLKIADELYHRYRKAKTYFDKLPQVILAKAFRGELVLNDPSDPPASELLQKIRDEKKRKTNSILLKNKLIIYELME